jgi:beta-glucosidase
MKKLSRDLALVLGLCIVCALSAIAEVPRTEVPPAANGYAYWSTKLSAEARAADLLAHMTLDEKISQLCSHGTPAIPRLGVAEYWWPGEALHGIANIALWYGKDVKEPVSTVYPVTLAQGSTWNRPLIQDMAAVISDEARAYYNESKKGLSHWAPTINLSRDPRWGRNEESFSEDPYLTGILGGAFVEGFQGAEAKDGRLKAIATIKHFAANNSEVNREYGESAIDERTLREYYLKHFEMIAENDRPAAVMTAYNSIGGIPVVANKRLVTDVLRRTWGFDGFVTSDFGAVNFLFSRSWTAGYSLDSREAAVAAAMKAGTNLELCTLNVNLMRNYAASAIKKGLISEDDVDKALYDLFVVRMRTGEFDLGSSKYRSLPSVSSMVYSQEHRDSASKVAEESVVLLKNEGLLPLSVKAIKSIVVVGADAKSADIGTYISTSTEAKKKIETNLVDSLAALVAAEKADCKVTHVAPALGADGKYALEQAQKTAIASADRVVLYLDTQSGKDSGEFFDRKSLSLPRGQSELAAAVIAANPKTVVFLQTCGIVELGGFKDKAKAMLWTSYNGQDQGRVAAEILLGKVNPSGRLSTTWYADEKQLGDLYADYSIQNSTTSKGRTYMYFTGDVDYPFGYGLSYTKFSYGALSLSQSAGVTGDSKLAASVEVKNAGSADGYEVVQLYVSSPSGYADRPKQRLMGFEKVWLKAGESRKVEIAIDASQLRFWDAGKAFFDYDLGTYVAKVGSSSRDIKSQASFELVKGATVALKKASIAPEKYKLTEKGATARFIASVSTTNDILYKDASNMPNMFRGTLKFTSSDPAVATVDDAGTVCAVGDGIAAIEAAVTVNGVTKKASCPIVVALGK